MNIGFDLDKIFIDYPPFVPAIFIDWLYRHSIKELFRKNALQPKVLTYKIPSRKLEKWVRRTSHFYLLRPKISSNIDLVNNFPNNPQHHHLYLISSRYSFLEDITLKILKRYHLSSSFASINLNTKNEQPHLFKARKMKELGIDLYIDDDLALLEYLERNCPKTKVLWYNPQTKSTTYKNIPIIHKLEEVKNYLPQ